MICNCNCTIGYCDDPETLDNGEKVSSGSFVGDTVTYSCNSGFNLSGDANRTCQSDGQWSGAQPKCNRTLNGVLCVQTLRDRSVYHFALNCFHTTIICLLYYVMCNCTLRLL